LENDANHQEIIEEEKHEICEICLDGEEKTERLECGHSFHTETCLRTYVEKNINV